MTKPIKYKIELDMADTIHKGEGLTLVEALDSLGITWNQVKLKGVLKITHGTKSLEKMFFANRLKKIFGNKLTRMTWAKNLDYLLKETATPMNGK